MEEPLENLKKLITQNDFIGVDELLNETADELLLAFTNSEFSNFKEHPDHESFRRFVEFSESATIDLIKQLALLIRYGSLDDNKNYQVTVLDIINKLIYKRRNETDKYGYIWQHISNYPLLLVSYAVNISLLRSRAFDFLYKLMTIPFKQKYMGQEFMDTLDILLPEAINSYNIFSDIDSVNVNVYKYLPGQVNNKTTSQQILATNTRVYHHLNTLMSKYFINQEYFDSYFDLYEYFLGLFIMYTRLSRYKQLPNRQRGEFAPYGRRYHVYSESGRYFNHKDSLVHKFIQDTMEKKNEILKVGFFGGKKENIILANDYYKDLLGRLTGY